MFQYWFTKGCRIIVQPKINFVRKSDFVSKCRDPHALCCGPHLLFGRLGSHTNLKASPVDVEAIVLRVLDQPQSETSKLSF